jgi:hypothetical protein
VIKSGRMHGKEGVINMGLFKQWGKRGAAKTLARSAYEAYLKYKSSAPNLTEAEIAHAVFVQRCSPRNLNKAEKTRFEKYPGSEKPVDSIFKLCLAMLYIVDDISENDATAYSRVKKVIEEELSRLGYKIPPDDNLK